MPPQTYFNNPRMVFPIGLPPPLPGHSASDQPQAHWPPCRGLEPLRTGSLRGHSFDDPHQERVVIDREQHGSGDVIRSGHVEGFYLQML